MRLRSILFGVGLGAAIAYLFDRERGAERRARLREQASSTAQRASESFGAGQPMSVVAVAVERIGSVRSRLGGYGDVLDDAPVDDGTPDDATLVDRIRSEALGDPRVPAGEINVDVADGTATLRGELTDQALIDLVVDRVRAVPGVVGVDNLLHTPAQSAKNKRAAVRASERAAESTPPKGKAIE